MSDIQKRPYLLAASLTGKNWERLPPEFNLHPCFAHHFQKRTKLTAANWGRLPGLSTEKGQNVTCPFLSPCPQASPDDLSIFSIGGWLSRKILDSNNHIVLFWLHRSNLRIVFHDAETLCSYEALVFPNCRPLPMPTLD